MTTSPQFNISPTTLLLGAQNTITVSGTNLPTPIANISVISTYNGQTLGGTVNSIQPGSTSTQLIFVVSLPAPAGPSPTMPGGSNETEPTASPTGNGTISITLSNGSGSMQQVFPVNYTIATF